MPNTNRVHSIDLLRGAVMIIMALDHTRDLFHWSAFALDPLDLNTASPALFMTRWITHFCAPVFVFLSGTSIYLQSLRKSTSILSGFLFKRGAWLLLVELTLITLALTFDLRFHVFVFQVIGAIGVSMMVLALLVRLPFALVLTLGLLIVFGHNLLDAWEAPRLNNLPAWYQFLHRPALLPLGSRTTLYLLYPVLPWTGIMLAGYCFGKLYTFEAVRRRRIIIATGFGLIALFIVVRLINTYGNPAPWTSQPNLLYTIFSFINTQKYPPSLDYTLMTLGPALIALGWMEKARGRFMEIVRVYGQVPFFYYILHFYLLHAVSAIAFFLRGHSVTEGLNAYPQVPLKFIVPGQGLSLGETYVVWILVVTVLYFPCRWYAAYKRQHPRWYLSYL